MNKIITIIYFIKIVKLRVINIFKKWQLNKLVKENDKLTNQLTAELNDLEKKSSPGDYKKIRERISSLGIKL